MQTALKHCHSKLSCGSRDLGIGWPSVHISQKRHAAEVEHVTAQLCCVLLLQLITLLLLLLLLQPPHQTLTCCNYCLGKPCTCSSE
jgi:hypothetical protein